MIFSICFFLQSRDVERQQNKVIETLLDCESWSQLMKRVCLDVYWKPFGNTWTWNSCDVYYFKYLSV